MKKNLLIPCLIFINALGFAQDFPKSKPIPIKVNRTTLSYSTGDTVKSIQFFNEIRIKKFAKDIFIDFLREGVEYLFITMIIKQYSSIFL